MAWQVQEADHSFTTNSEYPSSLLMESSPLDSITGLASPHVLVMDETLEVLDQLGARLHDEGFSATMGTGILRPA